MLKDDESVLPRRLRECRLSLGWTEEDVAAALHGSRSTVSNWESTGDRQRIPPLGTLLALARWYGVTLDWLGGAPLAERESAAVLAGKAALRKRFPVELGELPRPTPDARFRLAVEILQSVSPEGWFPERIAANLLLAPDRLGKLLSGPVAVPDVTLARFAEFVDVPLSWFYLDVEDIARFFANEKTG